MAANETLIRKVGAWVDFKGRREGWLAFILMRSTGIGLVVYLMLHFYMLRQLALGEAAWNAFIAQATGPLYLLLDTVLIFGLIYHAINGVRVGMLGLGYGIKYQAQLFWVSFVLSIGLTAAAVAGIVAMG